MPFHPTSRVPAHPSPASMAASEATCPGPESLRSAGLDVIPSGGPRMEVLLSVGCGSTPGPWPGFGVVLDGDPTVFPAAHTSELPSGRCGMSHQSWGREPSA